MFALCIESSHSRGMGHLYRSMILADELVARGHTVSFLLNDHCVSKEILQSHGYEAETVSLDEFETNWESEIIHRLKIRIWINDRLDTDERHTRHIANAGIPLVTFDDRGSGATFANIHFAPLAFDDWEKLAGDRVLHGVDYLVLNPDIARYRHVRHVPEPLLVTMGGSDTWGVTVQVAAALAKRHRLTTLVLGPGFEHESALQKVLTEDFTVKRGVSSMAEEMSRHGLAITGGGVTPFEANAAGLPCIVIANEQFEIPIGRALERLGGSVFAGHYSEFNEKLLDKSLPIENMSRTGMSRVGLDGIRNVVTQLEELLAE